MFTVLLILPFVISIDFPNEEHQIKPDTINHHLKEVLIEDLWGLSPEKMIQFEKSKENHHQIQEIKLKQEEPIIKQPIQKDQNIVQWNVLVKKKEYEIQKGDFQNQELFAILNISKKQENFSNNSNIAILMQSDEDESQWRPPILEVISEESNFKKEGFYLLFFIAGLLIICVIIRDYLFDFMSPNQMVVFYHCLKDSALLFILLSIILIFHYITPRRVKKFFNIYGLYYYVDLDKLIIQFIIFSLIWLMLAFIFSITYSWQNSTWNDLEEAVLQKDKIHLDYERLYLDYPNSPELEPLRNKLQYFVIRQSFIYPSFQPLLSVGVLREDFNFSKYLSRVCGKLYASILRINLVTLYTILIFIALGVLANYSMIKRFKEQIPFFEIGLLFPFIISFLLLWFYGKSQRILYQFCHYVDSPYDFKFIDFEKERHPFINIDKMPQPYFVEVNYTKQLFCNRQLNLLPFKSKAATIQIVRTILLIFLKVHVFVVLQTIWFIWFLYNYVQPSGLFYYTVVSITIGLSFINIILIIPRIIHLLAIVLNVNFKFFLSIKIYGFRSKKALMKVIFEQQSETMQFLEKLGHMMRAHLFVNYQQQRQTFNSEQESNIQISIGESQKKILKHAFIQIIQHERIDQIQLRLKQKLAELKEQQRQEEIQRKTLEAARKAMLAAKAAAEAAKKNSSNKDQKMSNDDKDKEFSSEEEDYYLQQDGEEENIFVVQERREQNNQNIADRNQRRKKKKKQEEVKVDAPHESVQLEEQQLQVAEPQGPTIWEQLKTFEKTLQEEIQNIDDATPFPLEFLGILGSLCGGNIKMWFQLMMAEKYFKFSQLEQDITFQDILMFSEFSQGLIERGINKFINDYLNNLFENNQQITLNELKASFLNEQNFSQTEIGYLLRELQLLRPKEFNIKLKDFVYFILDGISQFPS